MELDLFPIDFFFFRELIRDERMKIQGSNSLKLIQLKFPDTTLFINRELRERKGI